jgi:AbrB family looped-hinge helix DNA binding protein
MSKPYPPGKHIFGMVKVGTKGQIVIPKEARELFNIQPGDQLMMIGDEASGLAIITSEQLKRQFLNILHEKGEQ